MRIETDRKIAEHYGIGIVTLRRWKKAGLPAQMQIVPEIGACTVIDTDEVDAWILKHKARYVVKVAGKIEEPGDN